MPTSSTVTPIESGYKYVLAYGIVIGVSILISRTRMGYAIIYYILALAILFILVVEARFIAEALAPITKGQNINN